MKKRVLTLLLVFLLALSLIATGCTQNNAGEKEEEKEQAVSAIKIGGSSTLAPVVAKIADNFTEKYKTWNNVDPSLPEEPIVIFVSTGGSGFGVKSTIDGTFDLGLVAREVKDEEKEKMPDMKSYKIGADVLTISVNAQNPLPKVKPDLTTEELKKIFSGEIKTYKEIDPGLPDRPIVLCVRDLGGGASQVFDETVMKGTPVANEALQIPSMGALGAKIMENNDAIGYVSYGIVNQNKDKLVPLKVDGVAPTLDNILAGDYKIGRPLLVISKEEPGKHIKLFVDYMMSEEGKKVVEEMGYIPTK